MGWVIYLGEIALANRLLQIKVIFKRYEDGVFFKGVPEREVHFLGTGEELLVLHVAHDSETVLFLANSPGRLPYFEPPFPMSSCTWSARRARA